MKMLTIALLACLLSTSSKAGFEQFSDMIGYMNVFNIDSGGEGSYVFGDFWALDDLQADIVSNRTYELLPNVNTYADNPGDSFWRNNGGLGPDGNKWMSQNNYYELTDGVPPSLSGAEFSFEVTDFDLDSRYTLIGFMKVLNSDPNQPPVFFKSVTVTSNGTYTISETLSGPALSGLTLQAGWEMTGINANPATNWGSATVTALSLSADTGDTSAPTPDTMSFVTPPYALSDQAISMTATNATDVSGVEYYFTCTDGGGNDSGWQPETTYVDSGLSASSNYTYTVIARDLSISQNSNTVSAAASASTLDPDNEAPEPSKMSFTDIEVTTVTVQLTATNATDVSGVEYYFTCTDGGGNDSGWQSSPIYTDTGLIPSSNYMYTVIVRDMSSAMNSNTVSDAVSVTTTADTIWMINSLADYTGDSTQSTTWIELELDSLVITSNSAAKMITFDSSGATFGPSATWESRNILRTVGQDYGDYDFEAYATFIIEGTAEQAAFIGIGQGLVGGFGVPDFEIEGVNSVMAEMQYSWCKVWSQTNGVELVLNETAGLSTVTNRVKMVHDTASETVIISVDTDYAGGDFEADRILGTNTTVDVWVDAPQRVYIAAGAGVILRDLAIVADLPPDQAVYSGIASAAGSGMELSWEGLAGQTYEVQYDTDLVNNPTWEVDPSPGCTNIFVTVSGTTSATSTVDSAAVFYQVIRK